MELLAKNQDEVKFVKSRYGKEITVLFRNSPSITGVMKRYRGLETEAPQILLDIPHIGMIWVDLSPGELNIDMRRV